MQVVISGHKTAIDRAVELVKDHGIKRGILLPVSAPFHCPLMKPAADRMADALGETAINAPHVPVFANVVAAPISEPDEIRRLLVEQVTGRVRWRESAIAMRDAGVAHFYEFGGKVLSPMVKRSTGEEVSATSIVSMDDIEAVLTQL
jgi:[acyl-carrier-protein] S-malonyltransferase